MYNEYNDVASFGSTDNLYSAYSPLGRNFGHPWANAAMRLMFGQNYMPASDNGQSMYESVLQRNRSTEFMNLQRSGLLNNGMVSRVGLGSNPMLGLLSGVATPDSALARAMSPLIGGNPMASQMQLYAGLAGAGVMGNFGRMGAVSAGETEEVMQRLEKRFYNLQKYEGEGGIREEINARGKETFRNIAKGPNANEVFADLGFKGVKVDKEGNLNAKGAAILKSLNIADEDDAVGIRMDAQKTIKQGQASMLSAELEKALKEGGGELDAKLNAALLDKVRTTLKLSNKELEKFKTEGTRRSFLGKENFGGDVDVAAFKAEMAKLNEGSPFSKYRDEARVTEKTGYGVKGFNFANSRGFKLEDFTSAFVKAADLRMLGDRKGKGIAASMDDFTEYSGGAMSAARAVFGADKSGAELLTKISNMAGSEVDLGTKDGANKVEDLLRRVNATARVAGISIKTMLTIIDAGKQLAANHPVLQSTSSAAITELGMKAVGTAVSLGSTMSAKDYRRAGGEQGIASQAIKTAQEFAAGPIGATIAAAYYGASPEEKAKLDTLIKGKAVTGNALDETLRAEMADIRGITVGDLNRLSDNPYVHAEAMKDTDTASVLYGVAVPTIKEAMKDNLARAGLSFDEMKEIYKKSNGDFAQLDARVQTKLSGSPQGMRVWQHARLGIQEDLDNSLRSGTEQAAYAQFEALRNQSAADEKKMDEEYASKYAPLPTQILDALSSGTAANKDIPKALMHIFATSNKNTKAGNEALSSAQEAGKDMATIAGIKGMSDKDMINKRAMHIYVNKLTKSRKDAGLAAGDTTATAGLKDISKTELTTATEMGGFMDLKDSDAAKKELADLEILSKRDDWGDAMYDGSRKRLATLQTWEKTGIIDSTKAITTAQKGGVRAFTSATMFAAADANYKKYAEEEKNVALTDTSKQFDALQESGGRNEFDVTYLKNYYSDKAGKVDYSTMVQDRMKKKGAFEGDAWKDYWDGGAASKTLGVTEQKITEATNRANTLSASSPDLKARTDLGEIMGKLVEALGKDGPIGGGLKNLIEALNTF